MAKFESAVTRYDIYEGLLLKGSKRYYVENLMVRDFALENTVPHTFDVLGQTIQESSWGNLLVKTVDLLLANVGKTEEELLGFRVRWSKKAMFSVVNRTNHKPLRCGMFLCCNNTALHSCWLLQDLLDFFGVDKSTVRLVIHRSPAAEPKAVIEYMRGEFEKGFRIYLRDFHQKAEEAIDEIIGTVDKVLNAFLAETSPSYNDFFLFDEYAYAWNYYKKVKDDLERRLPYATRKESVDALELVRQYYSFRSKELLV